MNKYKSFFNAGKLTEEKFKALFDKVSSSPVSVDINGHIDMSIRYSVDVKGLKKIRRSDECTNQYFHYIEIKSVNGNDGWAYGDADIFAFEIDFYWIIITKEKLQELIKEKVVKEYVLIPTLYRLYQRKGRKDIITLVDTMDLIYFSEMLIKK